MSPQFFHSFLHREGLPADYADPTQGWLADLLTLIREGLDPADPAPPVIGIQGAQGTGKSTLAQLLGGLLAESLQQPVAVLSLDDVYRTRAQRRWLGESVHPLLATRGVPGTHDLELLAQVLQRLIGAGPGERTALPRFDKARDDRAPTPDWPVITGRPALILLEGWCLGVPPQPDVDLASPLNDLERLEDIDGHWRRWVNDQLRGDYGVLWSRLARLLVLQAPDWASICAWRAQQEHTLAQRVPTGSGVMGDAALGRFMQHFERLSRHALAVVPARADAVLSLDPAHRVTGLVRRP